MDFYTAIALGQINRVRCFVLFVVNAEKKEHQKTVTESMIQVLKCRCLRRYAANDKIFKLFFLHPFLASTIYNNTIKNKFDIG